jgi:colicin import membrane protein
MTLANIGEMLREILAAVKGAPALANDLAASRVEAADLKVKLSATEAERDSLKAGLAAKEGEATAAKAEAEKAAADVKAANEAKEKAESDLKALESNPSKQAVEIAAKAGVKASALPKGDVKAERFATKAEFDAMSFPDRNAFIRSGGKIRG